MPPSLENFIDRARQKGLDTSAIFLLLRSGGWKEKEIADALAEQELALAVPQRAGLGSAWHGFAHLLAYTALYAWAGALIYLLFTYIEFALPDPATRPSQYAIEMVLSGVRASLATLIVAYPLFLIVWWYLLRETRRHPETARGGMRRWLAFLSLFVGAVVILGDVTTVVYYFVEGDLTLRFLLKVSTLLVVAGGLFLYLAAMLRNEGAAK